MVTNLFVSNLLKCLPVGLKNQISTCLWDGYSGPFYSQEGEDVLLNRIFDSKRSGFFVDVGAHHPMRFSNTYFFYRRGWRGVNIDAMPGSMLSFERLRPEDVNIECGVGETAGELVFYRFQDGALNTFDLNIAQFRQNEGEFATGTTQVSVKRLEDILADYLPSGRKVDFLSVDTEGFDFGVLKSNNWTRYRPEIVLVEMFESSVDSTLRHPVSEYMAANRYELIAKTLNTAFFRTVA